MLSLSGHMLGTSGKDFIPAAAQPRQFVIKPVRLQFGYDYSRLVVSFAAGNAGQFEKQQSPWPNIFNSDPIVTDSNAEKSANCAKFERDQ